MNPPPVQFSTCPHCRQVTQCQPIRLPGPSANDALMFGSLAWFINRKGRVGLLCQTCRTVFSPPGKPLTPGGLLAVIGVILLVGAIGVAIIIARTKTR